jgi:hypothetical protein
VRCAAKRPAGQLLKWIVAGGLLAAHQRHHPAFSKSGQRRPELGGSPCQLPDRDFPAICLTETGERMWTRG